VVKEEIKERNRPVNSKQGLHDTSLGETSIVVLAASALAILATVAFVWLVFDRLGVIDIAVRFVEQGR